MDASQTTHISAVQSFLDKLEELAEPDTSEAGATQCESHKPGPRRFLDFFNRGDQPKGKLSLCEDPGQIFSDPTLRQT